MKHYEMLCVLPGTLTEAEVSEAMKVVTETVTTHGATITNSVDKGKSRLAYPIKHIRYGYFQLLYIEVEPEQLAEIERRVQLLGSLLRSIVRSYDPANQAELAGFSLNPQAQTKEASEEKSPAKAEGKKKVEKTSVKEEKSESTEDAEATEEKTEEEKSEEKDVSLEEIDNKLDEILEKDLSKV